jgi:hypothetical protein
LFEVIAGLSVDKEAMVFWRGGFILSVIYEVLWFYAEAVAVGFEVDTFILGEVDW